MRKQSIVFFLACLFVISVIAANGEEPTVYIYQDYEYIILKDGTAEIVNFMDKSRTYEMNIPETVDGTPVTGIACTKIPVRCVTRSQR